MQLLLNPTADVLHSVRIHEGGGLLIHLLLNMCHKLPLIHQLHLPDGFLDRLVGDSLRTHKLLPHLSLIRVTPRLSSRVIEIILIP